MDERELREHLLEVAQVNAAAAMPDRDFVTLEDRAEQARGSREHAESARALVEASTYLIPAQAPPSLSDGARRLLKMSLRRAWRELDYPEIARVYGAAEPEVKRLLDELEGLVR